MTQAQHYIGIDGGGSHTRALLADAKGQVLSEGHSGGSNVYASGFDGALAAIHAAVDQAFHRAGIPPRPVSAAWLGLAGMGRQADREALKSRLGPLADAIEVSHDMQIALSGGLAGASGIALIAGTGSACFGINQAGRTARCGGWGELADDAGSASWLGQHAIRVAVRQADGRLPGDEPMRTVFHFLGIDDVQALPRSVQQLSREARGRIAPLLNPLYEARHEAVQALYTEAGSALAELVRATARQLEMTAPKIVLIGGLACSGAPFQPLLEKQIHTMVPGATIGTARLSPAKGALLEAYKLAGIPITEDLLLTLAR